MKEIVIISGKGGTGKTTVTAAFASLAANKIMADCDVDAADLHLILNPTIKHEEEFRSGKTAFIREGGCTQCGKCIEVCPTKVIIKIWAKRFVPKGMKPFGNNMSAPRPTIGKNMLNRIHKHQPFTFNIQPRITLFIDLANLPL